MTSPDAASEQTTEEALQNWRAAERTVAVARRGRIAAETAAEAAEEAASAAAATAVAAKAALDSMALAETSAAKTAIAARLVVQSSRADLADSDADVSMAEVGEADAHHAYNEASRRARERS